MSQKAVGQLSVISCQSRRSGGISFGGREREAHHIQTTKFTKTTKETERGGERVTKAPKASRDTKGEGRTGNNDE